MVRRQPATPCARASTVGVAPPSICPKENVDITERRLSHPPRAVTPQSPDTARLETTPSISGANYRCSDDLLFTTGACPSRPRLIKRQHRSGTNALDQPASRPKTGA